MGCTWRPVVDITQASHTSMMSQLEWSQMFFMLCDFASVLAKCFHFISKMYSDVNSIITLFYSILFYNDDDDDDDLSCN